MAEPIFVMRFDSVPEWGEDGEFDLTRLTRSQLSHFKSWYGPEYGQRLTVITKAMFEDGDAVGCLVWACRREHGLQVDDPKRMPDFDPAEVFVVRNRVKCSMCNGTGVDPDSLPSEGDSPLGERERESTKTPRRSGSTKETQTSSTSDGSPE